MPAQILSTSSLLELIDLFERSRQSITDGDGQRLLGMPGWDFLPAVSLSAAELSAWTTRIGYAGHYLADRGDERVAVELEASEGSSNYCYRCPATFRMKSISADAAAVYAINNTKWLNAVADLLTIPQALRKGIEFPALDGALWLLGKARIGSAHTDVWMARGLAQSVDEVFRHFHSHLLPDQGVILSSGVKLPDFVRPPRNYRFAALRDVLIDYLPEPRLDIDLLHRILSTPVDGALRPVLPVHFNEYTNTLTIRSKVEPWRIKGKRQAAAVKYMFEQFKNGRHWLGPDEILAAAFPDKEDGKSRRMQNLFSGNDAWKDYIDNPEKGKYGFRLD